MDVSVVDAVLLDMDGTLVGSDAAVERAWTVWANEYGVEPAGLISTALPSYQVLPSGVM